MVNDTSIHYTCLKRIWYMLTTWARRDKTKVKVQTLSIQLPCLCHSWIQIEKWFLHITAKMHNNFLPDGPREWKDFSSKNLASSAPKLEDESKDQNCGLFFNWEDLKLVMGLRSFMILPFWVSEWKCVVGIFTLE